MDESTRGKIGAEVKRLRESKRLSQTELAARAKVGTATVSRIERGLAVVSEDRIRDVARALDVTVEELKGVDGPRKDSPTQTEGGTALAATSELADRAEVLRAFRLGLFRQTGMLASVPLTGDIDLGNYGHIVGSDLVVLDNIAQFGFDLPAQMVRVRRAPTICHDGVELERTSSGGCRIHFTHAGAFYLALSGVREHGFETLRDLAFRLSALLKNGWEPSYRLVTNCWGADHILLLIAGHSGSKIELGAPGQDGSVEVESSHGSILKSELSDARPMFKTRQLSTVGSPHFELTPLGRIPVEVALEPTPIEEYLGIV